VCLAYEMETPWAAEQNKRPGAALGWAALAPTYVRNYGEGYHIYDDDQTQLHKQNVSRKSNVTVRLSDCEWHAQCVACRPSNSAL
jgi:hypothetical protein